MNPKESIGETSWINRFKDLVETKPIVVVKFASHEWTSLQDSRYSLNEFTVARSHGLLTGVGRLTPCLMHGKSEHGEELYFGIINSVAPVTTLESRIKIKRGVAIQPR